MADAGAAVVIDDDELEPAHLRAEVLRLFDDRDRLRAMTAAARAIAKPDAADRIAAEILAHA
jgi:UDP-N-acetylglucosamine--N-acetylmuramyl-(pentapeptide) pyrophosphoryl-undecaprenol N-acetylglucosamine transferase